MEKISLLPKALVLAVPLIVAGCESGPSGATRQRVNMLLAQQNYAGADAYLDTVKQSQYGQKNEVLFYLDKGAVQQHEGKYKESNDSFDLAQKRMDELYTTSLTKAGGMLLLNDNTVDYAGEPFERALSNVYRAIDYVLLGQPEEALVESKKVEDFLRELHRTAPDGHYDDDAFARYLDAMLYADQGQLDDARISLDAARAAYADYAADYGMPSPKFEFGKRAKDQGELVLIHFNGVAPRKVSKTEQVAWGPAMTMVRQSGDSQAQSALTAAKAGAMGDNVVTVAYPAIVQDPYSITTSEVWVDSQPVGSTQLVEDVTAIAAKALEDRKAAIWTRAIARATIKFVLAQAAYQAAAKGCDQVGGYSGMACKLVAKGALAAAVAASETADTRGWDTLPSQIRMARVKVPAGKHRVVVVFKNAMGQVISQQEFPDVEIGAKKRTYIAARTAI